MRRASRAFASLFDKGRGLMVPRGSGGQVRVLTLVAMCIHCVCCFGAALAYYCCAYRPWLSQVTHREYETALLCNICLYLLLYSLVSCPRVRCPGLKIKITLRAAY
jgi:hypothetical protein